MLRLFKCLHGPAFTALAFATVAAAQTQQPTPAAQQPAANRPQPSQSGVATLRAGTQLVVVDIVVTDKNQKPVHGLTASDFTLTEETSPNLPVATLDIDGNKITAANQTKQFNWKSSPTSTIKLDAVGQTNPASGPLSVFHFAYSAKSPGPNKLQFIFQMNNQPVRSPSGVPLDYTFDVGGPGAPLLNPNFMRTQLRCNTKVAE